MPRDTFLNLPETKRKAIFHASVREFSEHMFSEASINRIVKTAQIPRGSFYQYFDGKEDLFSYVISEIFAEIAAKMQALHKDGPYEDALALFMEKVYATVALNQEKPEYVQITFLQSRDKTPFVQQFFEISDAQRQQVLELFAQDKRQGILADTVDCAVVIDMVFILSKEMFIEVGMDSGAYIKRMEAAIRIIREGIRRKTI